jgi:hypothetical protein
MKKTWLLFFTIIVLLVSNSAFTQSDRLILFQAEVATQSRQLLDGSDTYQITFSIWDSLSGGTQLWLQQISGVVFKEGAMSVLLGGTAAPFPSNIFTATERYLQMTITKGAVSETLAPRMKITSSAYMIAGVETTGCPSGMTKVSNFCIDVARSAPLSEKNALLACYTRGAKLCYWWQLMHACELALLDINKGTSFSAEVTSDAGAQIIKMVWANPNARESLPTCAKIDSPSMIWGTTVYLFYYRCCQ